MSFCGNSSTVRLTTPLSADAMRAGSFWARCITPATRDHPQRVPVEQLKAACAQLAAALPRIRRCPTPEELMGLEGEAAQRYFACFDSLILQQKETFFFAGRSRRPPLDPVNALLSFSYTLLARECAAAL